jgi:hypothetical protein
MTTATEPVPAFEVTVHIAPSSLDPYQLLERQSPFTYTAIADVLDVDGDEPRELLLRARTVVAAGKRETVFERQRDYQVRFTVAVSEKRDRAATEVVVTKNGRVLHRQKSNVVMDASAMPQYRRR